MIRGLFGIFLCVISDKEEKLGDIIKFVRWGSNRDIREKGIRVDEEFNQQDQAFSKPLKSLALIKDPNFTVFNGAALLTPRGKEAMVFRIGRLK
jgi:hypothetical protein